MLKNVLAIIQQSMQENRQLVVCYMNENDRFVQREVIVQGLRWDSLSIFCVDTGAVETLELSRILDVRLKG
jgi:predicted DNA-binding transcriptional regulator YafY